MHNRMLQKQNTTIRNQDLVLMEEIISLKTVPVVVRNCKVRMIVNVLLDDASTKTYINSDVAEQLKLKGIPKQVTVNVLNNQSKIFEMLHVEFNIEKLNEKINQKLSAYKTDGVTRSMRPINWKRCEDKWKHRRNINT